MAPDLASSRANWADDEEFDDPSALPPQQIISNPDGTKTIITFRIAENEKKIKTMRKIRTTVVKEHVNPRVAERKEWAKFGAEKGHPAGPDLSTTSVGENIVFRPSTNWKATQKDDESPESKLKDQLKDKKVACRICKGDHFTARCPFKDTLTPLDDVTGAGDSGAVDGGGDSGGVTPSGAGGGQESSGRYVAPHLRNSKNGGGRSAGESMMGGGAGGAGVGFNRERDDLATLRVTNVSELATEQDLRDMFERYGKVQRVFLAKDRETQRAKGFAFVSFADRSDAARACEKMDGIGYRHLILRVEFAKRSQ